METKPADLCMWVGKEFYPTPHDFISEALRQGVSKRIPVHNPPENIVPGASRLFFIHPEACVHVEHAALQALHDALIAAIKAADLTRLVLATALRVMDGWQRNPAHCVATLQNGHIANCDRVLQDLGVTLAPGIFAYCYLTGLQYVCKPDETQPPDHLRALAEPVIVQYDPSQIQAVAEQEEVEE